MGEDKFDPDKFKPIQKWRDLPALFAPADQRDRYLQLLFLHAVQDVAPECIAQFWAVAADADHWAARWLPGVPWGPAVVAELFATKDSIPLLGTPTTLPIAAWDGEAEWGEPRLPPEVRPGEQPASFATRVRRWESDERKRLKKAPDLVPARIINPDYLRWLARRLVFRTTYRQIAEDGGICSEHENGARHVRQAVSCTAERLGIKI